MCSSCTSRALRGETTPIDASLRATSSRAAARAVLTVHERRGEGAPPEEPGLPLLREAEGDGGARGDRGLV